MAVLVSTLSNLKNQIEFLVGTLKMDLPKSIFPFINIIKVTAVNRNATNELIQVSSGA